MSAARHLLWPLLLALVGCGPASVSPLSTQVDDWRDEVIYQIVTDRFDNGQQANDCQGNVCTTAGNLARHQGGDWAGITRRLGYLSDLGVTTIWISPLVKNVDRMAEADGYHGYWAANFSEINKRFGELEDLRQLVRQAHARGMKVIVDVVTNHTGRLFYYDLDGDQEPGRGELWPSYSKSGPYRAPIRWLAPRPTVFRCPEGDCTVDAQRITLDHRHFHRRGQTTDYTSKEQKEFGDFPDGLRDLDTEHAEVLSAMVDTYTRWVMLTDVDGFRLDAVPHVPHAFWSAFARRLRQNLATAGKHRFLLLGEAWHTDPRRVASYTREAELDSVFDFGLKWDLIDGFILDGKPAESAVRALEHDRGLYPSVPQIDGIGVPPWQARVAFADSHDMRRIRGELNDPFAAELALTVVFAVDAVPCVYYGTEQELAGRGGHGSREALWRKGFGQDTRMFSHINKLSRIRRQSIALRRGKLVVRYASKTNGRTRGPGAGLLAWERVHADQRAVVAVNGHPIDAATALVPTGFASGAVLFDALGARNSPVTVRPDGTVRLVVAPRRAVILLPAPTR